MGLKIAAMAQKPIQRIAPAALWRRSGRFLVAMGSIDRVGAILFVPGGAERVAFSGSSVGMAAGPVGEVFLWALACAGFGKGFFRRRQRVEVAGLCGGLQSWVVPLRLRRRA
jgi:hypothetical protein